MQVGLWAVSQSAWVLSGAVVTRSAAVHVTAGALTEREGAAVQGWGCREGLGWAETRPIAAGGAMAPREGPGVTGQLLSELGQQQHKVQLNQSLVKYPKV